MGAGARAAEGVEFAGFAVGLEVGVADELITGEEGEGVVTALAFGGGSVDFPGVFEIPESLHEIAVDDEGIQRSEETDVARGGDGGVETWQVGLEAVGGFAVVEAHRLHVVDHVGELRAFEEHKAMLFEVQEREPAGDGGGAGLG